MHIYKKSPLNFSRLMRYLADSNRRPRFCRPIPNHSGKVPFCGGKDTSFWRITRFFLENFYTKPLADNFSQFHTTKAIKSTPQYT